MPEEVPAVMAFPTSDNAAFVTGTISKGDGGSPAIEHKPHLHHGGELRRATHGATETSLNRVWTSAFALDAEITSPVISRR